MKWLIACLLALVMVAPAIAGEDPYIALVGNDIDANPFYHSPKYVQFQYDQEIFGVPVCFGATPSKDQYTRVGEAGCEMFRSQMLNNQPEVCDTTGTVLGVGQFDDLGEANAVVRAGNSGWYEWWIRVPKKPSGEINICIQCGVLKPNTFAFEEYNAVNLCAAETGERIGLGLCTRQEVEPGTNPLVVGALPKITVKAYPGPYNAFTPFNLTAFRNPGTYNPFSGEVLINNGAGQILNGKDGTRILLKSCMDKCIIAKLPVTDQVNAAGDKETDLEMGDLIQVKLEVPRANTVDIYCHAQSARIMGIGEAPF